MSVVIGVLQIALAIVLFEYLRIVTRLPDAGRFVSSAFGCSTAIVIFMGLSVGGIGTLLRYFTLEDPRLPPEPIHWLEMAAIVAVSGVCLAALYRKRRRARAATAAEPRLADSVQPKRAA